MTLNSENDIYQGDLATLNAKKHAWASADRTTAKYRYATWIVLVVGLAVIIFIMMKLNGSETPNSMLPLHLSIWVTAIMAVLVKRGGTKKSELPFDGFHMAHFEADENTLYYQYQKGLSLCTYYIKDDEIKKIYRDDKAGVILIEGSAAVNIQRRKNETEKQVSEFYALVPFDKYDLDDLLMPYKRKVKKADGTLREKFTEEHLK